MKSEQFSLKKVFAGASVYSIGEILVKASGFFLIPIFTRVLTPADYGIIGYLQVFLQLTTAVLAFGFHGAQTRYYYENGTNKDLYGRFLFTINVTPILASIILFAPITILSMFFDWKIGSAGIPVYPYLVLTLWTVLFQIIANNAVGYYRAKQQFTTAAILQVSRFLCVTGLSLLLILEFQMGALGRVAGLFGGMFIFLIFSSWGYFRFFRWKFSREALNYAFAFGAPLVIHLLAASIHNAIDRIILEQFVSLDEVGIYTLAFNIGNVFNLFIISFNQAYQPSYFQLMSSENKNIQAKILKTFKLWLLLISGLAMGGIVLGGPFLRLFAGSQFWGTIEVFPWIILAMFMSGFYYFFVAPIFYFKKTKYLPLITGVSAVVNIVLNLLFIPRSGIMGAAVATLISHIVQSIIVLLISQKLSHTKWPYGWILGSIVLVAMSVPIAGLIN